MGDFAQRRLSYQRYNSKDENAMVRLGDIVDCFPGTLSVSGTTTLTGATAITGALSLASTLAVDTINETTSGAGVGVDGVAIKDGGIVHEVTGVLNGAPLVNGNLPSTWITYFEDFIVGGSTTDDELLNESGPGGNLFSEVADTAEYLVTLATRGEIQACKLATGAAEGGWVDVLTTATQNHPVNAYANGTPWLLATGKKLYFETKIMVEDVDQCDWFIGLSIANTDILASGVGTVDDIIGFCGLHTTAVQFISNEDGTDTIDATAGTIADGSIATIATTAKTLAFAWDGAGTVTYYVDGTSAGTITTTADDINQDEGMSVAFVVDNSVGASAERMWIDYIYVAQER